LFRKGFAVHWLLSSEAFTADKVMLRLEMRLLFRGERDEKKKENFDGESLEKLENEEKF
jgi:hypothetical protein